jgi:putative tryptophan/tyrosine transport system substrate-binding protein
MRRREFITLLGGAAAGWPLAARAQQAERMRRIAVLMNLAPDNAEVQARIGAFLQGLQEFGWSIGRNVRIEYRWAIDQNYLPQYAAELMALAPDVVLANANSSMDALRKANRATPIVFVAVTDPVGSGFVQSLAQPGGNATGFTTAEFGMSGKRVAQRNGSERHTRGSPTGPHIRIEQHSAVRRDPGGGAITRC